MDASAVTQMLKSAVWCETTPKINPRLLYPKVPSMFNHCVVANHLVSVRESWPELLVEGPSLPLFIHPNCLPNGQQCCSPKLATSLLPEPLAICSSILRMAFSKTPANSAFIRKTLFLEQKRLYDEVCQLLPVHFCL